MRDIITRQQQKKEGGNKIKWNRGAVQKVLSISFHLHVDAYGLHKYAQNEGFKEMWLYCKHKQTETGEKLEGGNVAYAKGWVIYINSECICAVS